MKHNGHHGRDGPTEPGIASVEYVQRKTAQAVATTTVAIAKAKKTNQWQTVVLFFLSAIGSICVGFLSVRAIAQDAGAAPVAIVSADLKLTKEELARHVKEESESRARLERKLERQDEKQDLILDALRVPLWKRPDPEPKDGGR